MVHLGNVTADSNGILTISHHNTRQIIEEVRSLEPVVVEGVAVIRC